MKWKLITGITVLLLGLILFVLGMVASQYLLQHLFVKGVEDGLVIDKVDDSDSYKDWESSDCDHCPPYYQNVYMWNLTNADAVQAGAKPAYALVGPYSYTQYKEKFNVVFQDDGNEVTYSELKQYYWSGNTTPAGLSEHDVIVNINPMYLAVMGMVGGESQLGLLLLNKTLNGMVPLFTTMFPSLVVQMTVQGSLKPKYSALVAQNGSEYFYATWANATQPPSSEWAGFLLSYNQSQPSGISAAAAAGLWDPAQPYSMLNPSTTAMGLWSQVDSNDPLGLAVLKSLFGLSDAQVSLIVAWRAPYANGAVAYLLNTFQVPNIADLGYVQWGTGAVTGGVSVKDLAPSLQLPFYPEISIFANKTLSQSFSFDLATSKALLSNVAPKGLLDIKTLATFMTLAASKNWTMIQAIFGLDQSQSTVLNLYLQYIASSILTPVFANGGGLITKRTVREWLWDGTDPLLALLGVNTNTGLLSNDTSQEAAVADRKNSTFYTGKGEISQIWEMKAWMTDPYIEDYARPIPVTGTTGNYFAPFVNRDDTLIVLSEDLYRPVNLTYVTDTETKGITTYRFQLSNSTLNPDPLYFQAVQGIANMTSAYSGLPIFITKPTFYEADPVYKNKIDGMVTNATEDETWLDIEPITGYVLHAFKRLQINVQINNTAMLSVFNPKVQQDTFYPLFYVEQEATLSDNQADKIKNDVLDVKDKIDLGKVLGLWLGVGCAVVGLLVGGGLIASFVVAKRTGYKPLD